ncbi:MAG: preprotein translocase subunit SecA [Ruminococcaceae bacterium]|nr:preprotein translocase subunit SecA [Oscillospiraceae bacterium]
MGLFEKIFGSYSDRALKEIKPIIEKINALEPSIKALNDDELRGMTDKFKARLKDGETLDDILPEAFAVVREAAWRVLGQRHYDVQLIGGVVLHQGRIAEMKTGEGKTLVSTLPAYLNALEGKGVHVVTVNDYLAKRDSEWMGKIYNFLGLTVGVVIHDMDHAQRQNAYACDITYGTNNELGFDYLRDNMVVKKEDMVQRELHFAVVDEVDSILIDEARTPLIISGQGNKSSELYEKANDFAVTLKKLVIKETDKKDLMEDVEEDYIVDEKAKTATLTRNGIEKAEAWFNIECYSDPENAAIAHHINQAIKAHGVMARDIDYVVKDNSVLIVDEFTGRIMIGRRYNEGLHQAIEAKEHVKVEKESMTLATITFQNYFRMYNKLSGMTGTALTEEEEFNEIYSLDVIVIPTNKPVQRVDHNDAVFKSVKGKYMALVNDVTEANAKGQPVLVGTVSIEKSEYISKLLMKRGIKHNVLNAKHHEREAEIVAQAGKLGAVTIATNMAGRGTDITLGGNAEHMAKQELRRMGYEEAMVSEADGVNDTDDALISDIRRVYKELVEKYSVDVNAEREKVREAGGLFIMGTERHESRRIDNQLRGRSGRQGDPGESRFYISFEDDIMRLFGSEKVAGLVNALDTPEDEPVIEMKMITKAIENAQKQIESRNFETRKYVLKYDDVINQQREIIYGQRRRVLDGEDIREVIINMIKKVTENAVDSFVRKDISADEWNFESFRDSMAALVSAETLESISQNRIGLKKNDLTEVLLNEAIQRYEEHEKLFEPEKMREYERSILLRVVDTNWMTHIDAVDQLKHGIGLRSLGQHDPVVEYQFEASDMFDEMNSDIQKNTVRTLFTNFSKIDEAIERQKIAKSFSEKFDTQAVTRSSVTVSSGGEDPAALVSGKNNVNTFKRNTAKVGRNDKCPCGSGKKYKDCCGSED